MRSQYFVLMDKRPSAAATLGAQLEEYHSIRPFGGLVVPWVPFGSSGHIMRPKVRPAPPAWAAMGQGAGRHCDAVSKLQHALAGKALSPGVQLLPTERAARAAAGAWCTGQRWLRPLQHV